MAQKTVKTKWALGGDEPEDLGEFLSNDDIVRKNTKGKGSKAKTNWPSGQVTLAVKRLTKKPNRNGDDRIGVMLIVNEPKKSEHEGWNGYVVWDGFNVTEQGAPWIKRFLKALGLSWSDFINKTKEQTDGDKAQIVAIGSVKFGEGAKKDPEVVATIKVSPPDDYNDDEYIDVRRYIPVEDLEDQDDEDDEDEDEGDPLDMDEEEDEDEDDDDEDDEEDDDDEEDEDEEDDEDEDEEDDDEDEEDDEDDEDDDAEDREAMEAELRDLLKSEKVSVLKKRALRNDKKADLDGLKKSGLVDLILEQELPPF